MNNTPTPETDAAWESAPRGDFGGMIVMANLARKLERERDEAKRKLETYRELCNCYAAERDQLRKVVDSLTSLTSKRNRNETRRSNQSTGGVGWV